MGWGNEEGRRQKEIHQKVDFDKLRGGIQPFV